MLDPDVICQTGRMGTTSTSLDMASTSSRKFLIHEAILDVRYSPEDYRCRIVRHLLARNLKESHHSRRKDDHYNVESKVVGLNMRE